MNISMPAWLALLLGILLLCVGFAVGALCALCVKAISKRLDYDCKKLFDGD